MSDVVALGGMPAGTYALPTGQVELTQEGRLEVIGTQILAGAVVPTYYLRRKRCDRVFAC